MKISPSGLVVLSAALVAGTLSLARDGEKRSGEVTLAADKLPWEDLAAKGVGVMVADVEGIHAKGAWHGFVKFPVASKSPVHAHSHALRLVVVSGTFRYGSDPDHEQPYGPGSYVFIPANLPHSNSQPDGAVVYVEQPGKYDNKPAGH